MNGMIDFMVKLYMQRGRPNSFINGTYYTNAPSSLIQRKHKILEDLKMKSLRIMYNAGMDLKFNKSTYNPSTTYYRDTGCSNLTFQYIPVDR